jgi:transposase-like protein
VCIKKKEKCPYCLGTDIRPKGWNRKKTKRRLKCSNCKKHITTNSEFWFVGREKIELINAFLLERLSLRGICRVVKISLSWLLPYISKLCDSTPDNLNYRQVKNDKSKVNLQLIDSELDEMWPFVGRKK